MMNSAATVAFGFPTSFCLSRQVRNAEKRRAKRVPEEELAVEIADINGVHVDDMNILEAGQSQVGKNLAAETTSANDEYLCLIPEKVFDLDRKPSESHCGIMRRKTRYTPSPARNAGSVRGPGVFKIWSMS
jgi:hypothetical protein